VCAPSAEKHFTRAVDLYSQAIALTPDNAILYSNRAAAHMRLENYGSALGDATLAIEKDPKYIKARTCAAPSPGTAKEAAKDQTSATAASRLRRAYVCAGGRKCRPSAVQLGSALAPDSCRAPGVLPAHRLQYRLPYSSAPRQALIEGARARQGYYRRADANLGLGKVRNALNDFRRAAKVNARDPDLRKKLEQCEREVKRLRFEEALATPVRA